MANENPNPSTPLVVSFSAILAAAAFILVRLVTVKADLPPNENFEVFSGVATIIFGIGFCIFVLRKRDLKVSFAKLFVSGWITTVLMGVIVAIFYYLFFERLVGQEMPEGYLSTVILKYNAFGMIFSVLLGYIFKKQ